MLVNLKHEQVLWGYLPITTVPHHAPGVTTLSRSARAFVRNFAITLLLHAINVEAEHIAVYTCVRERV